MGVIGTSRAGTHHLEEGRLRSARDPRMSAGWGYPMEISGLPCGKSGVTAWKFRGYRVENSALPQALVVGKLLAYVLHCLIVIDEFPATNLVQEKHLLKRPQKSIRRRCPEGSRSGQRGPNSDRLLSSLSKKVSSSLSFASSARSCSSASASLGCCCCCK
jgi:hypothetical protein